MTATLGSRLVALLRSPLLPIWLVPALLPIGRTAEIAVVLALVGCVGLFVRNPRALDTHDGAKLFLALWGCYVAAALISAVDAVNPGKSWSTVASVLRYAPLGVYVAFAVRREPLVRTLYAGTALVVAVWLVDAWVQATTGYSVGGAPEAVRLTGVFGAENLKFGPVLSTLAPFLLWYARERWGRRGLVVAFLVLLGPVLLSGSRASWFSYALVAVAFLWREVANWKIFAACMLALGAVGALGVFAALQGSDTFAARYQRTLLALQGSPDAVDYALAGRLRIWRTALEMVEEHPVNGVGVRGFRYDYAEHARPGDDFVIADGTGAMHAHQWVLEVASETGLVGLALWIAGIVLALRAWHRATRAARERAFAPAVALVAMAFPLNTHLAFYSAWWGLVFWWLVALYCAALTADLDERGA
ncbi:MAG TPA: O-antigen ligase family protein [Tahibacter sp.]|nr:O-antigen ligase family protein [Tahibacter sp.]